MHTCVVAGHTINGWAGATRRGVHRPAGRPSGGAALASSAQGRRSGKWKVESGKHQSIVKNRKREEGQEYIEQVKTVRGARARVNGGLHSQEKGDLNTWTSMDGSGTS